MLVSTLLTLLAVGITTAVPLDRRDVALDAAATAEAQQRDSTATRAFTATTITVRLLAKLLLDLHTKISQTSDGRCLSVDPFSGDFRENLTPVLAARCDGSKNQTWDVITAGVHNNVEGQALIVSSLVCCPICRHGSTRPNTPCRQTLASTLTIAGPKAIRSTCSLVEDVPMEVHFFIFTK